MMSLRFNALLLTFLLIASQAFAQVIVSVDMKQTGPTAAGAVLPRVGKNTDATYRATASYNGKPVLHAEEKVTKEKWTSAVTIGPGATGDSTEETIAGDSVVISAKSADPGTYSVSIKFTITFTIESPNTKREDPYSGNASATLNVKNGIFEVKIKPTDLIPQYTGDTNGYRNKLGIGEKATVLVFPEEGSTDTVVLYLATSSDFNVSDDATFTAGEEAKQGTIQVYACINGSQEPDGPETIGITVLEPNGAEFVKVRKYPHPAPPTPPNPYAPYVGFRATPHCLPNDVSFSNVEVMEGVVPSIRGGYWKNKYPNGSDDHPEGDWVGISTGTGPLYNVVQGTDNIESGPHDQPPAFEDDSFFQWNIPWFYRVKNTPKRRDKYFIMIHRATMDKNGNMTITKGGVTESTPPY